MRQQRTIIRQLLMLFLLTILQFITMMSLIKIITCLFGSSHLFLCKSISPNYKYYNPAFL